MIPKRCAPVHLQYASRYPCTALSPSGSGSGPPTPKRLRAQKPCRVVLSTCTTSPSQHLLHRLVRVVELVDRGLASARLPAVRSEVRVKLSRPPSVDGAQLVRCKAHCRLHWNPQHAQLRLKQAPPLALLRNLAL
eukprot:4420303-Prymnesium_polylepis.1